MTKRTALVVDDSKSARFALRKYLEAHAYQVQTAESADEAFRYLQDRRPDVIFLDHVMPGADGFDVIRQIKNNPKTAAVPVVICSSNEGEAFVQQALARGAADVLQKPPSQEQLRAVLENLHKDAAPAESAPPAPIAEPVAPPAPAVSKPGKVSPIREPEVAIEQAVMKAVRAAMEPAPAPAPAAPEARPALAVVEPRLPAEFPPAALAALREPLEARLRKITQDLYLEVAAIKAQVAHLDVAPAAQVPEIQREVAALKARMDGLRGQVDDAVKGLEKRFEEVLAAARHAATEEAHAVAERAVLNAAARISDQLAQGIVKAMTR